MLALEQIRTQAGTLDEPEEARPYSIRPWGEIARLCLPPPIWFLGECFALGHGRVRLHAIFGQGGLGKSRIGMNIARNQVLGLDFGGMPTGGRLLRHLFMGTENGLHRLQHDIRKMSAGLSSDQLALLNEHIFLKGGRPEGGCRGGNLAGGNSIVGAARRVWRERSDR